MTGTRPYVHPVRVLIAPDTRLAVIAGTLVELLAALRELLALSYGVGVKAPHIFDVAMHFGPEGGRDFVELRIPIEGVTDGGAALRRELDRRHALSQWAATATRGDG